MGDIVANIARMSPGSRMSQAVVYGGLLYTAGQVDAQSGTVAGQTQNVLAKIDALLAAAGSSKSRVLRATIWLSDIAAFDEMNSVWDAWIDPENPPARATVESRLAGPDYKVEIAIIAAAGS
jgi:enamine deaminase RidA (YjgF/YER057c/UK114 family)